MSTLRQDFEQRLKALETFLRSEFQALSRQVQDERTAREEEQEATAQRTALQAADLDRRVRDLNSRMDDESQELRSRLLAESNRILQEVRNAGEAQATRLKNVSDSIGRDKADRATLAQLFSQIALELNGDFEIPSS